MKQACLENEVRFSFRNDVTPANFDKVAEVHLETELALFQGGSQLSYIMEEMDRKGVVEKIFRVCVDSMYIV